MTPDDIECCLAVVLAADFEGLRYDTSNLLEAFRERETMPAPPYDAELEMARERARTAPTAAERTEARLDVCRLTRGWR